MSLLKTYTLYLRDGADGESAFEPALCKGNDEAVARAMELLGRNPQCHAVDVFFGEQELFRVKQPTSRS